ncbi:MAG: hypothetical protein E7627_03525 [Ruminococcaceae bacterium]|nr:hypothetical protein [Oscillospiraceae bacterium]
MKKERRSFPLIGASSLIVIFAVVCLTVFAMLSLNTTLAGERLSQKNADSTVEYYKAEAAAQEILAKIRADETPSEVQRAGNVYTYSCKVSEGKELFVNVTVNSADDYNINIWQVRWTDDWTPDDSINVWDGN